jgi:hypothetical protein
VLGPPIKDALGFVQTAAGKQQLGYTLTIAHDAPQSLSVGAIMDTVAHDGSQTHHRLN